MGVQESDAATPAFDGAIRLIPDPSSTAHRLADSQNQCKPSPHNQGVGSYPSRWQGALRSHQWAARVDDSEPRRVWARGGLSAPRTSGTPSYEWERGGHETMSIGVLSGQGVAVRQLNFCRAQPQTSFDQGVWHLAMQVFICREQPRVSCFDLGRPLRRGDRNSEISRNPLALDHMIERWV